MSIAPPIPENEAKRLLKLSEFDIDYSEMQDSLKDLTKLAAKVAGTSISFINLIDVFTQWSVSRYGLDLEQMPREDSVCQYTIMAKNVEGFEVKDLRSDDRFKDKPYVAHDPNLTYYFGVPLQTDEGYNIGALCMLDKVGKEISPEKVELLKIIANEIVNRLTAFQAIKKLRDSVKEAKESQRKVAHDIRGPLGGIVSLAQIIAEQGDQNKMDQVLQFIQLIHKSGNSLLDLANEILTTGKVPANKAAGENEFNLSVFKGKLEKLFMPQAVSKNINLVVILKDNNSEIPVSKEKLLQIAGNLISNAIKFTPAEGTIAVELGLAIEGPKMLSIIVKDTGTGMDQESIDRILSGNAVSREGTGGEQGYGFGLSLVKHLVEGLRGTIDISSEPGKGTIFTIQLPQS